MVRQSADPFGSRRAERGPGWAGIAAGLLVVAAGVAATVAGIAGAVDTAGAIEEDAVGRGVVRELSATAGVVAFTVPAGDRRDYTVYLLFDGVERNSVVQELMVRDTGCVAVLPDAAETRFRGARQGTAATVGQASSVGHFSSQPGRVRVRCAYVSGTRRSERTRADAVPYVVTPGTPGEAGADVVLILAGVFGAIGGGFLAWWGWTRRRVYQR
ncbi:MAG TPA: hypothetical protein VGW10_08695 [Solirubrobacteraceae bacterium]|nr:hypothetical protein [Solirubrobacteraceae bacterium]